MKCSHCKTEINAWYQRKDGEKNLRLCNLCKNIFDAEQLVPARGVKQCPVCSQTMYETIGNDCNDYYRCDKCNLNIRIFHKRKEVQRSDPEDYPTGHS